MKQLIAPAMTGLIVTSASFFAGRYSVGTPPPPPPPAIEAKPATPIPSLITAPAQGAPFAPVKLTGDAAQDAATALAVLGRPDPFDKLSGEVELLRQLKPENAEAIKKAYHTDQAMGRSSSFENGLYYLRLGQIGGFPYLETRLPQKQDDGLSGSAGLVMQGWASVQPTQAAAWFKTWPHWKSRGELARALLKGLGSADVSLVEKFVAEADLELKGMIWPEAFAQLASIRGIAPALSWGEKELLLPESKLAAQLAKEQESKRSLLKRMLDVAIFLNANQARDLVSDEKTGRFLDRSGWEKLLKELARLDPVGTINWMQSAPLKREEYGQPLGVWPFNEAWIANDAASCAQWIDANPNHSLRDFVAWTYALKLKHQDAKAAAQLMMTMKNEKLRSVALGQLAKE